MDLILIISQEHETIPISEIKAVLFSENIQAEIEIIRSGLVYLKNLKKKDFINNYKVLVKRLGYTHEILEIISTYNIEEITNKFNYDCSLTNNSNLNINNELNKLIDFKDVNWNDYIQADFAVRVKRFTNVSVDTPNFERNLGGLIKITNNNFSINLDNPSSFIKVLITEKKLFLCIRRFKLNKKHFQDVKPHKRPFFYPGSMSPKLARAMVNLSRVKKGDLVLDPFCGTGGILIEAGLIGTKLIGSDIQWKMKNGTGINLDYYGISDYKLHHLDVREMKLYEKVDAVVTDPPYGISTSTGGENSENVFYQFLDSISKNMKTNGIITIASPDSLNLDKILNKLDFKLLERHKIKMHKSLTRVISVISKNS
jgi:tRNA (guanine10-N2)-dimethyltransferase